MTTKRRRRGPRITTLERDLQKFVLELAGVLGWRVAHFRASRSASGRHLTAVAADGAGFPDLVLVRDRVIFAELKGDTGRVKPDQQIWREALERAGAEYHLWFPGDADVIEATLRRRARP